MKGNIDNSNKKALQRMMIGLKKVLDLHNPIELSSICGSLFLKVQDHAQCIKFSNEVIDIDPNSAGSYQNLATSYLEMHNFTKAED